MSWVDSLVGGKVSTQERRGRTLVGGFATPARRIGAFIISIAASPHSLTNLLDTRISSTTGTMSQPVVQTIHRDPALLYVGTAMVHDKASQY
jgi:hypothetical protein